MRVTGRILAATLWTLAVLGGPGLAQDQSCAGVESLARTEMALPRVAAAIKDGELKIAVVGSASSLLPAQAGPGSAYPKRLEAALAERLPGVKVTVANYAKPRRTASEMAAEFERIAVSDKPALVIWQTGTVDAMRGIDHDEFRATLEKGIDVLHAAGADVVFMNMQYSPRTQSVIAVDIYADTIRWVALHREIPLFDRLAIMKQWNELGVFDLYAATRGFGQATRVHDCIGRLLADMIVQSAEDIRSKAADVNGEN